MKKLLIFTSMTCFLFSCNEDKKTEGTTVTPTAYAMVSAKYWPYYKLDRAKIEELIDPARRPDVPLKYQKNKTVILQHALTGMSGDTVSVSLIGFASTNHAHHGRLTEPFQIRDSFKFKQLQNPLILGNNDLAWDAIGEKIFIRTGPNRGKLHPDFDYILFEPMDSYVSGQHPGCTTCAGHLWYKITAYKKDGTLFPGMGGGGTGSTNPSPPAVPGN